jgi:hypothetical protein
MKILLLGEYSAVHKNLKDGLKFLGHEVDLASSGDGWKNIPRDIDIDYSNKIIPKRLAERIYPWIDIKKFLGYDIVQIMSPDTIFRKYFLNNFYFKILKKYNKKIFLLASGGDAFYWKYGRSRLKYGPFEDVLKYDLKLNFHPSEGYRYKKFNEHIANLVDGIIPNHYEYEISYKGHKNLLRTLPTPINTQKIKYEENNIRDKLIIFHGLNRYGIRGTRHVEEAFRILEKKYPNELDMIIDGYMPLEKYVKVLNKANIVIDQTNSHSVGVNGLYALALGKVVFGGAEPESLKSLGLNNSPVINIKPNAQSIVEEVEKLLERKDRIKKLGLESREFVENNHGHIKVAEKFTETWNGNI